MENSWECPTFDEEEQFTKKQMRKQNFKNFGRCYCNLEDSNQTHRCQQLENKFVETFPTSSSSSESDSDEEFTTGTMNKPYFKTNRSQQMQQLTEGRKWFTVVELEGLRPQEVTAELNLKCRILLIKLKMGEKLVRVVPLPTNIAFEKLQVQVVLRANCLLVAAPFTRYGEETLQHQVRNLPTWIPIRVTIKTNVNMDTIRAAHHYQPPMNKDFPTHWISYDRFKRYWKQRSSSFPMEDSFFSTGYYQTSFYQPEYSPMSRYNTKWDKRNINTNTNTTGVLPLTEVIYDEVLHKPVMLLKINVLGFRTEEVRVRVEENQRILIVEAVKKSTVEHGQQQFEQQQEMTEQQHLTTKYLRREFCLPRFLDVEHIDFRVLKSGVLLVKLPIVKQHLKNVNSFTCRFPECGCDELKKDLQQFNYFNFTSEWEKPLRA